MLANFFVVGIAQHFFLVIVHTVTKLAMALERHR